MNRHFPTHPGCEEKVLYIGSFDKILLISKRLQAKQLLNIKIFSINLKCL